MRNYMPYFESNFCRSSIETCSIHSASNKLMSVNEPAPTNTSKIFSALRFSPLSNT